MAKKYTRKQVSSLSDLDLEQERIKYKAKRIEDDMLDIFSPQQLALTLVGGWLRRKKKNAPERQQAFSSPAGGKKKLQKGNLTGNVKEFVQQPMVKKLARKAGISFLRWQAFNLALFIGKKVYRSIREKRRQSKWQHA